MSAACFVQCSFRHKSLFRDSPVSKSPPSVVSVAVAVAAPHHAVTKKARHVRQRCRRRISASSSSGSGSGGEHHPTLVALPALCFGTEEPFTPGSSKTLHLFEARTIGAFNAAVQECGGLLVHACVAEREGGSVGIVPLATLARVTRLERQEVGVEVEILAENRVVLQGANAESDGGYLEVECHDLLHPSSAKDADQKAQLPTPELSERLVEQANNLRAMLDDVLQLTERVVKRSASVSNDDDDDDDDRRDEDNMLWGHRESSDLREALAWADRRRPVTVQDLLAERARSGDESVSSDNFERAAFSTAGSYSDLAECVADADAWKELVYADRLAFSALQAMPASSREDANELTKCRSYALGLVHGCQGLEERLAIAASLVETQLQTLRAKVALMTLDVVD